MTKNEYGQFPLYEGTHTEIDFTDTYNDCILMTVKGATKEGYESYLAKLTQATDCKEIVAPHGVLKNTDNLASIYTISYEGETLLINVLWIPAEKSVYGVSELKVSAEPIRNTDLSVFDPASASTGPVESLLIQIGQDGINETANENGYFDADSMRSGMAYAYRLCDGSFFLLDGGGTNIGDSEKDKDCAARIYQTLKKYSPSEEIVIAGWYFSHPHVDHFGGFMAFAQDYINNPNYRISLEHVICYMPNIPVQTFKKEGEVYSLTPEKVEAYTAQFEALREGGTNIHKAHAGQIFYLRNLSFEVLFSYDLLTPKLPDVFFDSTSSYSRMKNKKVLMNWTGGGRDFTNTFSIIAQATVTVNEETAYTTLWTGDASCFGIETVNKMYGAAMKSDFVQVPHHGGTQMTVGKEDDDELRKYYHQIQVNAFFGAVREAVQENTPISQFPEHYNPDGSYGFVRAKYVLYPSSVNRVNFYDDMDNLDPSMDVNKYDRSNLYEWNPLYHLQDEARLAGGDSYLARCFLTVFTLGSSVTVVKDHDVITAKMPDPLQ